MAAALTTAMEWAASEFSGAHLGDRRRCSRLVRVAAALARDPHGTLPGSFEGWSEVKAAYRLLEEPDVCYDRVMAPHRARVQEACRWPGEYLLVEDTTSLDFTSHLAAQDLGRIGDDGGLGLYVHSTLALRIERWNREQEPEVIVEGLFDQCWWARRAPARLPACTPPSQRTPQCRQRPPGRRPSPWRRVACFRSAGGASFVSQVLKPERLSLVSFSRFVGRTCFAEGLPEF